MQAGLLITETHCNSRDEWSPVCNCTKDELEGGTFKDRAPVSASGVHSTERQRLTDRTQFPTLNCGRSLHFIWTGRKISVGVLATSGESMRKSDKLAPKCES
jgi:hypothetical protein